MSQPARAVYRAGKLHLLEPVGLSEGQEVHLMILSDEERVRAALGDLLLEIPVSLGEEADEESLAHEVEEGFRGQPPLSATIIEERRQGP